MDHVHKESHVDSVNDRYWETSAIIMVKECTRAAPAMVRHWETSPMTIGQKDNHPLLH